MLLTDKRTKEASFSRYLEVLQGLPQDIRNKVMAHEKVEIESRFVRAQPTKDWADMWFKHINEYDSLALYAVCQNKECKRHYPVLVHYNHYRSKLVLSNDTTYLLEDCHYCKVTNSLRVFDNFEHARSFMNKYIYSIQYPALG